MSEDLRTTRTEHRDPVIAVRGLRRVYGEGRSASQPSTTAPARCSSHATPAAPDPETLERLAKRDALLSERRHYWDRSFFAEVLSCT